MQKIYKHLLPRRSITRAIVPQSHRLHFTHVIGAAQQEDCDVTTLTHAVVATGQHVYVTLTKTAYTQEYRTQCSKEQLK